MTMNKWVCERNNFFLWDSVSAPLLEQKSCTTNRNKERLLWYAHSVYYNLTIYHDQKSFPYVLHNIKINFKKPILLSVLGQYYCFI